MSRMNQIESFDAGTGVVVCQAGAILEVVDSWVRDKGHIMPLDLGAKVSGRTLGVVAHRS